MASMKVPQKRLRRLFPSAASRAASSLHLVSEEEVSKILSSLSSSLRVTELTIASVERQQKTWIMIIVHGCEAAYRTARLPFLLFPGSRARPIDFHRPRKSYNMYIYRQTAAATLCRLSEFFGSGINPVPSEISPTHNIDACRTQE